ncbi:hypothetical protein NPIL_107891 [Nephila pilipes]|uniref:Uncharacterized protein n=1 Tax=Nephila pilipes TaxID=299642 RepID=A0A8X6UIY7_NEPPI|nr:hypothetical protein NPIL_107891 [Nephila pilipes]
MAAVWGEPEYRLNIVLRKRKRSKPRAYVTNMLKDLNRGINGSKDQVTVIQTTHNVFPLSGCSERVPKYHINVNEIEEKAIKMMV